MRVLWGRAHWGQQGPDHHGRDHRVWGHRAWDHSQDWQRQARRPKIHKPKHTRVGLRSTGSMELPAVAHRVTIAPTTLMVRGQATIARPDHPLRQVAVCKSCRARATPGPLRCKSYPLLRCKSYYPLRCKSCVQESRAVVRSRTLHSHALPNPFAGHIAAAPCCYHILMQYYWPH